MDQALLKNLYDSVLEGKIIYRDLPLELQKRRQFNIELLKARPNLISQMPAFIVEEILYENLTKCYDPMYRSETDFFFEKLFKNPKIVKGLKMYHFWDRLCTDMNFLVHICKSNPKNIHFISHKVYNNIDFYSKLCQLNPKCYALVPKLVFLDERFYNSIYFQNAKLILRYFPTFALKSVDLMLSLLIDYNPLDWRHIRKMNKIINFIDYDLYCEMQKHITVDMFFDRPIKEHRFKVYSAQTQKTHTQIYHTLKYGLNPDQYIVNFKTAKHFSDAREQNASNVIAILTKMQTSESKHRKLFWCLKKDYNIQWIFN